MLGLGPIPAACDSQPQGILPSRADFARNRKLIASQAHTAAVLAVDGRTGLSCRGDSQGWRKMALKGGCACGVSHSARPKRVVVSGQRSTTEGQGSLPSRANAPCSEAELPSKSQLVTHHVFREQPPLAHRPVQRPSQARVKRDSRVARPFSCRPRAAHIAPQSPDSTTGTSWRHS